MDSNAISIRAMDFAYQGQQKACFKQLNLQIACGDRFGLFGPNGAGKTTLMQLMTGLLKASTGSIEMMGVPIGKGHKKQNHLFGYVPQDFAFYPELSPVENLEFFGAWCGLNSHEIKKRTNELIELLGLTEQANKPTHQFSGGMKRKVNLAISVIHQPKILFLDEPTVGVDIQTRNKIVNYLKGLNEAGITLIYTSHQLNEAAELCNTIALIDQGRIIAQDNLPNLLLQYQQSGLEDLFIHLTGQSAITL